MARILIVDDTAETRDLVSDVLMADDHKVLGAANGREAMDVIESEPPDLVILDVMMPVMDGYSVLREMRQKGLDVGIKVLLLTAKTMEADWVRGLRLGADRYLTKPFEVGELLSTVEAMLASSKQQLKAKRLEEIERAQLLSRLESLFDDG